MLLNVLFVVACWCCLRVVFLLLFVLYRVASLLLCLFGVGGVCWCICCLFVFV